MKAMLPLGGGSSSEDTSSIEYKPFEEVALGQNPQATGSSSRLTDTDASQYAQNLQNALKKGDKEAISEILLSNDLSGDDLAKIMSIYNDENGSLIQQIDQRFSSNEKTYMMDAIAKKLVEATKTDNPEALSVLCEEIYNGTKGQLGTADEFISAVFNNSDDETLAKVLDTYKAATGSELYKNIQDDFGKKDEEKYLNRLANAYQNARGEEYLGWDDGDLSIQEGFSAFGSGAAGKVKEQISSVASFATKHPVAAAGVVGGAVAAAAAAAAFPVVAGVLGVIGIGGAVVGGVKAIGSGIQAYNKANNATTDQEAKEGFYDLGGSATETAEAAAALAMSSLQVKNAVNTYKAAAAAKAAGSAATEAATSTAAAETSQIASGTANALPEVTSAHSEAAMVASNAANNADDVANVAARIANGTDDAAAIVGEVFDANGNIIEGAYVTAREVATSADDALALVSDVANSADEITYLGNASAQIASSVDEMTYLGSAAAQITSGAEEMTSLTTATNLVDLGSDGMALVASTSQSASVGSGLVQTGAQVADIIDNAGNVVGQLTYSEVATEAVANFAKINDLVPASKLPQLETFVQQYLGSGNALSLVSATTGEVTVDTTILKALIEQFIALGK